MRGRLLLLVLGLLFALGVVEVARVADRVRCRKIEGALWEPRREFGWGHIAGARGWTQGCLRGRRQWRTYVRINDAGLREREIPSTRDGRFRILVLGNSFMEGLQVVDEDLFSRRLEMQLDAAASPGTRLEVINAGTSGWGTDNALLYYRHEGWRYAADLVVLAFNTGNDVMENHDALMQRAIFPYPHKPHFVLDDGRLVPRDYPLPAESAFGRTALRLDRAAMRWSAAYRLLRDAGLTPRPTEAAAPPGNEGMPTGVALPLGVYLTTHPAPWQEAWRVTRGLVLRLAREVAAHGARFVVVVISHPEAVSPRRWDWNRIALPELQAFAMDPDRPDRLITGLLPRTRGGRGRARARRARPGAVPVGSFSA